MKKIFTLLVAFIACTASFAQKPWSHQQENRGQNNREPQYGDTRWSNDHNYAKANNNYNYRQTDRRYNERERQRQIDQINRECDQKIYSYRNDRSISTFERNRGIRHIESERSVRINSFGTGAIIGATAGLIIGAILSH
jgi:hypothetical protein